MDCGAIFRNQELKQAVAHIGLNMVGTALVASAVYGPIGLAGGVLVGISFHIGLLPGERFQHFLFNGNGPMSEMAPAVKLIGSVAIFIISGVIAACAAMALAGCCSPAVLSLLAIVSLSFSFMVGTGMAQCPR